MVGQVAAVEGPAAPSIALQPGRPQGDIVIGDKMKPYVIGRGNEVVFVDDCEGDLVLAELCFRESGAKNRVVTFSRAKKLMEFLQEKKASGDPQPDVIFLDINMPEVDGFEVLCSLKQDPYFSSVPVVFMLTNSDNPEDQDHARRLGATDYFVKPSSPRAFTHMLREIRV